MRSIKSSVALLGAGILVATAVAGHPSHTQARPDAVRATATPAAAPHVRLASGTPRVLWGLTDHTTDGRHVTENKLNARSTLVGHFVNWQKGTDFPGLLNDVRDGAVPLIAWMPQTSLGSVLSGSWDTYIRHWLRGAHAFGHPVMVRLMPEMNANEPYAIGYNGNTSSKFVSAWRHVVRLGRAVGASNVVWVWNPDRHFKGSVALKPLYPGRDYVDWVGIDGYNFGTADRGGWLSFRELIGPTITRIHSFAPYKPLMVPEVGCTASTHKGRWMRYMFHDAPTMGIRAVVYFDYLMARDWRIASSSRSLSAARDGVHSSNWAIKSSLSTSTLEYWVTHGL